MHDVIIIRYSEIALKGKNRGYFEKRLLANISECLKNSNIKFSKISIKKPRILVYTSETSDILRYVFGIASFSYAKICEPEIPDMKKTVDIILHEKKDYETFRISATRSDNSSMASSLDTNIKLGEYVATKYNKKVKLKGADLDIGVDVFDKRAFVFAERINGAGGLPLGSTGKAVTILDRPESLFAALLMMKRGCSIFFAKPLSISNDYDTSWIEKYNNCRPVKFVEYKNTSELSKKMQWLKINTVILGETAESLLTAQPDENLLDYLVLRPLAGVTNKEAVFLCSGDLGALLKIDSLL